MADTEEVGLHRWVVGEALKGLSEGRAPRLWTAEQGRVGAGRATGAVSPGPGRTPQTLALRQHWKVEEGEGEEPQEGLLGRSPAVWVRNEARR